VAGDRSRRHQFAQGGPRKFTTHALDIQGDALASMQSAGIFSVPVPKATATALPAGCMALPPGHRRRIFFGFEDVFTNNTFGLGYEEVDQRGKVVPGTQRPVTRFDPSQNIVRLPLGPGQTPVHETWGTGAAIDRKPQFPCPSGQVPHCRRFGGVAARHGCQCLERGRHHPGQPPARGSARGGGGEHTAGR
jgi:hypothetical protein